jgi:hypothetical protein
MIEKVCQYQIFPEHQRMKEGIGCCVKCKPDELNKQCISYHPIFVRQLYWLMSSGCVEKIVEDLERR